MDVVKVPEFLDHAVDNLIGPVTKGIGQTVGDIWFLLFGGPVSQVVQRRQVKYAMALEQYRLGLSKKLEEIPEEKRIEPSTQIIMSAMADAQYCVEEDELRHMFENLISSSVNADRASLVHPSFSGVIKQMTSFDARVLMDFKASYSWPIVNYSYKVDPVGIKPVYINYYLGSSTISDHMALSASIECLIMLGLVSTNYISGYVDESSYEPFRETEYFKSMLDNVNKGLAPEKCIGVGITHGCVELTGHGQKFLSVCMPD